MKQYSLESEDSTDGDRIQDRASLVDHYIALLIMVFMDVGLMEVSPIAFHNNEVLTNLSDGE